MPPSFRDLTFGTRAARDETLDCEVIGGGGATYAVAEIGRTKAANVANGTTLAFQGGDMVQVLYPRGDRMRGRIIGRIPGRRAVSRTVFV